ncbi:MAG: sulfite exporter TauE/SafE family protein [Desulfobulbaceae bacterium]|nr:sulfite exporter TauE/SafE family protein [Desulfobulbaceae bacterium]
MYFPVADIETSPWLPPLVAFGISLFTSMGGVSGAFMLLPFQVSFLNFNSPAVSATNHLFNIVAIPSGVLRYIREGRMVWPLTWTVIIGTLPGVFIGSIVRIRYLPDPTSFKRFAALVLLYIGIRLLRDIFKRSSPPVSKVQRKPSLQTDKVINQQLTLRKISYTFREEEYQVASLSIIGLSLIVGIVGGIYGIGGGAIIAPFFVTFFGLPVYTVAGAALMGTLITSIAGVTFFQIIAPFYPEMVIVPDWRLGILFGLGGAAGMYCGARLQRFVPAVIIKTILAFAIFFTAARYLGFI